MVECHETPMFYKYAWIVSRESARFARAKRIKRSGVCAVVLNFQPTTLRFEICINPGVGKY